VTNLIFKKEVYEIVGICMEVHRELGFGFKEAVYKDALEIELKARGIPFEREKGFTIMYKGRPLCRKYYADFILFNSIVLEVKASSHLVDAFVSQIINYLKASELKLGLIANFGGRSFVSKRVIF